MRLIILKLLLLLVMPASAQITSQAYFQMGLQGSSMSKTGPIETKGLFMGYRAGMGGEMAVSSNADLRLGLGFSITFMGYEQHKAGNDYTYRMHFTEIPVYASYPIGHQIRIEGGGYVSGLVRARMIQGEQSHKAAENYRNFNLGLLAGVVLMENKRISPYLRFQHGLVTLLKYPQFAPSGEETGTYRLLLPYTLTAGIRLNFL